LLLPHPILWINSLARLRMEEAQRLMQEAEASLCAWQRQLSAYPDRPWTLTVSDRFMEVQWDTLDLDDEAGVRLCSVKTGKCCAVQYPPLTRAIKAYIRGDAQAVRGANAIEAALDMYLQRLRSQYLLLFGPGEYRTDDSAEIVTVDHPVYGACRYCRRGPELRRNGGVYYRLDEERLLIFRICPNKREAEFLLRHIAQRESGGRPIFLLAAMHAGEEMTWEEAAELRFYPSGVLCLQDGTPLSETEAGPRDGDIRMLLRREEE